MEGGSLMDKDLQMLHKLIKLADKEIAEQNSITEILIDQFNNKILLNQFNNNKNEGGLNNG